MCARKLLYNQQLGLEDIMHNVQAAHQSIIHTYCMFKA